MPYFVLLAADGHSNWPFSAEATMLLEVSGPLMSVSNGSTWPMWRRLVFQVGSLFHSSYLFLISCLIFTNSIRSSLSVHFLQSSEHFKKKWRAWKKYLGILSAVHDINITKIIESRLDKWIHTGLFRHRYPNNIPLHKRWSFFNTVSTAVRFGDDSGIYFTTLAEFMKSSRVPCQLASCVFLCVSFRSLFVMCSFFSCFVSLLPHVVLNFIFHSVFFVLVM